MRWPGHYSMTGNWISDLGAANSPLHWVMNGSFIVQGVLIINAFNVRKVRRTNLAAARA